MVGFPGETDEEFEASIKFAEEMAFARMHVFVYSPRTGTPAAGFPNQVPERVKTERGRRMRNMAKALEDKYLLDRICTVMPVLFETRHGEYWEGHTPEYIQLRVCHGGDIGNKIIDVRLEGPGIGGIV
jgi:threonylcarbamoyladenosine tRNA methylthiotransferase MtaB